VLPKRNLLRIVRTPNGVRLDETGKAAGRGAYLHDQRTCWEAGLRGSLARALKVDLSPADREGLQAILSRFPTTAAEPQPPTPAGHPAG
jgi:hypothetical protein